MDKYLSVITNFGCHGRCPYCIVRENGIKVPKSTVDGLDKLEDAITLTGATRTATATEQSHPMTITALITNRNNKKRTQLRHKLSIISSEIGMIVLNIGYTDILMRYHSFFVKMMVSW